MSQYLFALVEHAVNTGLIHGDDRIWALNRLLEVMRLDEAEAAEWLEDNGYDPSDFDL